jgi:hypothetical protein
VTEVRGDVVQRSGALEGRVVGIVVFRKSMAGAEKRLAFWQNSNMFYSHCLILSHLNASSHVRDVYQLDVSSYFDRFAMYQD